VTNPDPYHELSARERNHLLAAAWYAADHDAPPSMVEVTDAVETLTGHRPDKNTTSNSLAALADAGLIKRIDKGAARLVRVTGEGHRVLERGAARLDAAATVEADVSEQTVPQSFEQDYLDDLEAVLEDDDA
jgi:predicted MarR family transcription regulator